MARRQRAIHAAALLSPGIEVEAGAHSSSLRTRRTTRACVFIRSCNSSESRFLIRATWHYEVLGVMSRGEDGIAFHCRTSMDGVLEQAIVIGKNEGQVACQQ
jgi:hypothetical protein